MVASSLLMLAVASHVLREQMSDVAHAMRERRRRALLMELLMHSKAPLTTRTSTKVERSPNGWLSSTMYGYVFGKDALLSAAALLGAMLVALGRVSIGCCPPCCASTASIASRQQTTTDTGKGYETDDTNVLFYKPKTPL
jgi:hypothetical protein